MKNIIKDIITLIIISIIMYLEFSFIQWEFNLEKFGEAIRFMLSMLILLIFVIIKATETKNN